MSRDLGRAVLNKLGTLGLCVAVSCTHAPMPEPQPAPMPADGAQAVPIQMEGPRAAPIDASAPGPSDDLQTYALVISRKIRAQLTVPSNVPDAASAIYEITLAKNGAVARLRSVKRSGFPAYDAAIRRAILRAQPFPQLAAADPARPTRIQLSFRVKD